MGGEVVSSVWDIMSLQRVVGEIMAPKDIQVLIPRTCDCYLIWQKDFSAVNKLRIWRWQDILGYPGEPKRNHSCHKEAEGDFTTERR